MSRFRDLNTIIDPNLRLPVRGREITIPAPSAADFQKLQRLYIGAELSMALSAAGVDVDTSELQLDEAAELDFYKINLGSAYAELVETVSGPELSHIANTAFVYWNAGEMAAITFWENGLTAQGGAIGSPVPPQTVIPTHTEGESTTRSQASPIGTSTRRPKKASAGPIS